MRTVVDALDRAGVTATLKHFPGLGRVQANTDTTAVVMDAVTTVDDPQVTLFGDLARSAAPPFVMVSSATYYRSTGRPGRLLAPASSPGCCGTGWASPAW